MIQTEDSKSRLQLLLDNNSFRIKLQLESIDQLARLLRDYSTDLQTSHDESRECEKKLWQLWGIDEKLRALQLNEDQTTLLLLYIYVMHLFSDRSDDNMQKVAYRLKMMHERSDSVWLLGDCHDWVLPKVHTFLLLQQTVGDTTNQCPADGQQDAQLLHKFTGRLIDWLGSMCKQQRLHESLSLMLKCWPQYSWVR